MSKKIDFTKIMACPSLESDEKISINLAKELGNAIYKDARDLDTDTLARTIYGSTGEIEITDNQAKFIIDNYVGLLPYWMQTELLKLLK